MIVQNQKLMLYLKECCKVAARKRKRKAIMDKLQSDFGAALTILPTACLTPEASVGTISKSLLTLSLLSVAISRSEALIVLQ